MKLLIHDFAGHPFEADLSRALARRGHHVTHAFCGGVTTGQGALTHRSDDPPTLDFVDVMPETFERYSARKRLHAEFTYGQRIAALCGRLKPRAVLSANSPLLAQARLWREARRTNARRVYWLQDFLGHGTRAVLTARSPLAGATLGRAWETLETQLLKRSSHIVAISDDFIGALVSRHVDTPTSVIENWTPLSEIELRPKVNAWSEQHALNGRPLALYSGTLGLKHDPEHLVAAARAMQPGGGAVAVVTEGIGREHLEERKRELGLDNLLLFDFVPYEVLPDVLAAADVLLVLLEREAGVFSVPSKVLTYLAAGRPIVGAIPSPNLAARTITRAGAGEVVAPGDYGGFATALTALLADPPRIAELGNAARSYAVATFDVEAIASRFEQVLA